MTTQQEAHLLRIKADFDRRVDLKYRAGVKEHSDYLGDLPDFILLEHAIAEAIDQFCYLSALGEKLAERNVQREIMCDVEAESESATRKNGPFRSAHEGFAVILEELDELKAEVWKKEGERNTEQMRREAIQVAAMAIRFILDLIEIPHIKQDAIDAGEGKEGPGK